MSRIDVTATGEVGAYDVTVDDGGRVSRHRVRVPDDLASVGLPEVDHERLVRESFEFLLEREPASAIMSEFELTVIVRYFPEYQEELRSRLA